MHLGGTGRSEEGAAARLAGRPDHLDAARRKLPPAVWAGGGGALGPGGRLHGAGVEGDAGLPAGGGGGGGGGVAPLPGVHRDAFKLVL